jgi:hypothetical protein
MLLAVHLVMIFPVLKIYGTVKQNFTINKTFNLPSQWPRGLRLGIVSTRSNTGIVSSNPTRGMDVRARLFCVCVVLCAGSGLATG